MLRWAKNLGQKSFGKPPSSAKEASSVDETLTHEAKAIDSARERRGDRNFVEESIGVGVGQATGVSHPVPTKTVLDIEHTKLARRTKLDQLVGLALSGGGIRSATFNLGVIQGLAKNNYLTQVDYLSSVSGGGYISAWLVAWIKRTSCAEVEKVLCSNETKSPSDQDWRYLEPNPIRFLRR